MVAQGTRFVGRERELSVLRSACDSDASAFLPIYGRRRVGKSELILRLLDEAPGIYHLGKQAPGPMQIGELLRQAARATGEPLLEGLAADGWKHALLTIVERWPRPEKLVLALDEFQWMVEASPELPSVLQECWDRHWRDSGRVLLILCGSYVGFMEREVLGKKSPLFGRRTAQIHLQPFSYDEAALFHPRWSLLERVKAYFLCGGIPHYLRLLTEDLSFEANLERCLLDEYGPLHAEADFLLREELRDVKSYYAVLTAITSGATSIREISRRSGIRERSLPYYLDQLVSLGYVARRRPLSGTPPNRRQVRFVLDDPLLRFYFRFVFPNLGFLQQRGPGRTLRELVRPELSAYFGLCFERLCREALPRLYEREGISAGVEVGEFWSPEVQIDVVGLRDDGWIDVGEARWGTVRSAMKVARELEEKLPHFPAPPDSTLSRRIFLRKKPARGWPSGGGIRWHDLADLYS